MRIYLAGPDVFLPDPHARAEAMKAVCSRHGLTGVWPLDALEVGDSESWQGISEAARIAARNEAHIASCSGLIANLTAFRGPSADPGTIFELGYMRALNRPLFGWTNTTALYAQRSRDFLGSRASRDVAQSWRDEDGMLIEDFGLVENLMIDSAISASGGSIIVADVPVSARWSDLSAFERCVEAAANVLREGSPE